MTPGGVTGTERSPIFWQLPLTPPIDSGRGHRDGALANFLADDVDDPLTFFSPLTPGGVTGAERSPIFWQILPGRWEWFSTRLPAHGRAADPDTRMLCFQGFVVAMFKVFASSAFKGSWQIRGDRAGQGGRAEVGGEVVKE